jgi:hypothetical protein
LKIFFTEPERDDELWAVEQPGTSTSKDNDWRKEISIPVI